MLRLRTRTPSAKKENVTKTVPMTFISNNIHTVAHEHDNSKNERAFAFVRVRVQAAAFYEAGQAA